MLRIQRRINNVRDLKKATYRTINKLHDLERGHKINNLYSKTLGKDTSVVLLIFHLQILIRSSLIGLTCDEATPSLNEYLQTINELHSAALIASAQGKPLAAGFVAELLRKHTRLFNILLNAKAQIRINPIEMSNLNLVLVTIWGNKIRLA